MDAIKRASFASKQIKAGPAPLASFEDLPSDELESPEDVCSTAVYHEYGNTDLQFHTPDSLTFSSQSTPKIESDLDSQYTLTPGDPYQGQSSSDLRTVSLSSLSKEDLSLCAKQKKGSAVSLGTNDVAEVEFNQRKASWTDIFKTHDQNTTKSSNFVTSPSEKTSKKKSHKDLLKDYSEPKSKEKGKFLSIFKKKSNKTVNSAITSDTYTLPDENLNITECHQVSPSEVLSPKLNNGNISKGKENESPEVDFHPTFSEVQNDLGKVNTEFGNKMPEELQLSQKHVNISEKLFEKEYNILSKVEGKQVDEISKTENIKAIVEECHESSESELTFEVKETALEKKEVDFEAETLLPHDLSEIEEDSVIEIQAFTFETPKQIVMPSREQRLKIITKPIDRPRSTTPINVAPLEAFIQSVSPTFDPKVEKIKLSLPGEQFTGRDKSPKKSSMKSWTDFCERGLHSPRIQSKSDKDEQKSPFDSLDSAYDVSYHSQNEHWAVAFESKCKSSKSNVFSDNFAISKNFEYDRSSVHLPENSCKPFETNLQFVSCSCVCHMHGCGSCSKSYPFEQREFEDEFLVRNCLCHCHNAKN